MFLCHRTLRAVVAQPQLSTHPFQVNCPYTVIKDYRQVCVINTQLLSWWNHSDAHDFTPQEALQSSLIATPPSLLMFSNPRMTSAPHTSTGATRQWFVTTTSFTNNSTTASPLHLVVSPFNIAITCRGPLGRSPMAMHSFSITTLCWQPEPTHALNSLEQLRLLTVINGRTSSITEFLGKHTVPMTPVALFPMPLWYNL